MIQPGKTHIVLGDWAEKILLSNEKLAPLLGPVVSLNDDLTVGPIASLERVDSRSDRKNWFCEHLSCNESVSYLNANVDSDYMKIQRLKDKIRPAQDIYIWCGRSSYDKLATARLLYALRNEFNNFMISDLSQVMVRSKNGNFYNPDSLGIIRPEEVHLITGHFKKLTENKRLDWIQLWIQLVKENGPIRTSLDNGVIKTQSETYFDQKLLSHCKDVFLNAARVIGETLPEISFEVIDYTLNWRLLELVKNKELELIGVPGCIREYEIKRADHRFK